MTHERGDASAVSIAVPSEGSCGMDVHFPEAPSNVHPWYPHSISPFSFTRPSLKGTSLCGHLSAVHRNVSSEHVGSRQNTRGSPRSVNVRGALSSRSSRNATGYHWLCQSKSDDPPASVGAGDDAGGSATAVGTSEAPRQGEAPLMRTRGARALAAEEEARRAVTRAAPRRAAAGRFDPPCCGLDLSRSGADAVAGDAVGAARVSSDILCGWSAE